MHQCRRREKIEKVSTSLELDEHIEMQKRGWRVQAIGMMLVLTLVVLASIGMFGNGMISKENIRMNGVILNINGSTASNPA
ncbi:hypothetical protein [Pseudochryseolinea flava]|uniref:Uncharacterized protein n=1 Tax=Pseudochryseolinea flava TaxID=2059302 RepID=A0A364Y5P8_9BACT|nr:hypothetical protein [Pseudochryseolinea flava]RAW02162.1 hypothetical protein DQQ10_06345 [Pseudochryseolinea flava]